MADEATPQAIVVAPSAEHEHEIPKVAEVLEAKATTGANRVVSSEAEKSEEVAIDAPEEVMESENTNDKQPPPNEFTSTIHTNKDVDMSEQNDIEDVAQAAGDSVEQAADTPASTKNKTGGRRKSVGVPEHKKKANKKGAKVKETHTDAQPGDYFYIRLKGYPLWPGIVCDESMLPQSLLKTRPVTAARADGTYREDYQDGGARVKDRTFPVMYLSTNEFSWVPNYDLLDLDFDTVGVIPGKMRKDLAAAHTLAAEQHDLQYFKEVLQTFMEGLEADRQALEELMAAKEADKAAKEADKADKARRQSLKKKASKAALVGDGDVDMPDTEIDGESGDATPAAKSTKRPGEPLTGESKKIKLSIKKPQAANGTATPKPVKDSTAKTPKSKTKKATPKVEKAGPVVPKEPEPSAEEKHATRQKEILFLRHKLQKGLLTKDQEPKEDEMKQMSDFINKLEAYSDLEVSIIRGTKINKVLKAILKLSSIPKEDEFQFKTRSQSLLDKWNKLLASDEGTPTAPTTNGTSKSKVESSDKKTPSAEPTNGVSDNAEVQTAKDDEVNAEPKAEPKAEDKVEEESSVVVPDVKTDVKDTEPSAEESVPSVDEPAKVESSA